MLNSLLSLLRMTRRCIRMYSIAQTGGYRYVAYAVLFYALCRYTYLLSVPIIAVCLVLTSEYISFWCTESAILRLLVRSRCLFDSRHDIYVDRSLVTTEWDFPVVSEILSEIQYNHSPCHRSSSRPIVGI
jgi:hypothetical protein